MTSLFSEIRPKRRGWTLCALRSNRFVMSMVNRIARDIVNKLSTNVRTNLTTDPISTVREHFGLDVIKINEPQRRGHGGSCDGFSFLDAGTIYYRPSWTDRQYFTVAHELAHFLIEGDDPAMDWLSRQPRTRQLLEKVCDAVASRLLIPDELMQAIGSKPSGLDVATLHNSTYASRSACVIRVAERLPCDGFIALINPHEHEVFFASRHEETVPYAWQGDAIPQTHPLRRIEPGQHLKMESWWPFPNGETARYYFNAFSDGDWIYAIFTECDLWGIVKFHPPAERQQENRPELSLRCDCGFTGSFRGYPCPTCRKPYCPRCKRCDCDRLAERPSSRCSRCQLTYPAHLLDDGICVDCQ